MIDWLQLHKNFFNTALKRSFTSTYGFQEDVLTYLFLKYSDGRILSTPFDLLLFTNFLKEYPVEDTFHIHWKRSKNYYRNKIFDMFHYFDNVLNEVCKDCYLYSFNLLINFDYRIRYFGKTD
jgi:hypothetical protein